MSSTMESAPLPLPAAGLACSGDELFQLGLRYSIGQDGAPRDYVTAHMMFNLAALRGSLEAKIYRKELSDEMDPADIAEAQRAAREWLARGEARTGRHENPPADCHAGTNRLSTRPLLVTWPSG